MVELVQPVGQPPTYDDDDHNDRHHHLVHAEYDGSHDQDFSGGACPACGATTHLR